MLSFITKKKITEERTSKIFVNGILSLVDEGFKPFIEIVSSFEDFETKPFISKEDDEAFLFIVLSGNLFYISNQFHNYQDVRLMDRIHYHFGQNLELDKLSVKKIINSYQGLLNHLNHPSKNTKYAMSKAIFHKYKLYDFQDEYFRRLKSPNPIILKKINELMDNFIWDWSYFLKKYRIESP
ncbi:MAG: hypothetical protein MRY83_19910 [Flavobacteriales bacterium]|nr:hypothetical protein [Flavobacteriales bacterium]